MTKSLTLTLTHTVEDHILTIKYKIARQRICHIIISQSPSVELYSPLKPYLSFDSSVETCILSLAAAVGEERVVRDTLRQQVALLSVQM